MMGIFESVKSAIKRYGSSVLVMADEKEVKAKAFVEPLRYKNRVYIGGDYHILGRNKKERYLYIGLPEIEIFENKTVIQANQCKYIVKRCEKYFVNDMLIYIWAIIMPFGERLEDEYDSDSDTA